MLKTITTVFFLSCVFANHLVTAQPTVKPGVKAGANFSTFIGDDIDAASTLIGPHVGGLAQFSWEGEEGFITYVIQPELFYSMQGAKSGQDKTVFSYLNLSTMVQRYIGSTGFHIETGPQVGFLLAAKAKGDGATIDIKSQVKSVDFSLLAGLGYKFNAGFGINVRYGLGISSFDKNGYDMHNATITAGLFYVFGSSGE